MKALTENNSRLPPLCEMCFSSSWFLHIVDWYLDTRVCIALAMLTVSHSHKCYEIWTQDSIYVGTEICFSYSLRQRRFEALGLRLSPKRNTYYTQFTEEILSFSLRIPAPTVGNVGIRPVQYSDFKVPARTWPLLYVTEVFSSELPLCKYAPNFQSQSPPPLSLSLSLYIYIYIYCSFEQ